jgi:hypothetical protein
MTGAKRKVGNPQEGTHLKRNSDEKVPVANSACRSWQSVQALSKLGHFLGSSLLFSVFL